MLNNDSVSEKLGYIRKIMENSVHITKSPSLLPEGKTRHPLAHNKINIKFPEVITN